MAKKNWRRILSYLWPIPVYRFQSRFSGNMNIRWEKGRLSLNSENANYSFARLHRVMSMSLDHSQLDKSSPQDVLVLGMGAGSVLSILRDEWEVDWPIDSVEVDRTIIQVAKEFFDIERYENHHIHHMDAEQFIVGTENEWSLIIVDLFIDREVSDRFLTKAFWDLLEARLRNGGKLIFNHMDNPSGHPLMDHLTKDSYQVIRSRENRVLIYRKGDRS